MPDERLNWLSVNPSETYLNDLAGGRRITNEQGRAYHAVDAVSKVTVALKQKAVAINDAVEAAAHLALSRTGSGSALAMLQLAEVDLDHLRLMLDQARDVMQPALEALEKLSKSESEVR